MDGEAAKKEVTYRIGIVNFERRKYPRFNIDLPIEYCRAHSDVPQAGRAINASEGGLLIYFPERMEVGWQLELRLFFSWGAELNRVDSVVEVVWTDIHLGEAWGDYRSGVRFVSIAEEDFEKLKQFLKNLSGGG